MQIRKQQRPESLVIDNLCTPRGRIVHPDNDSNLDPKVEWNKGHHKSKDIFANGQKRKDHPVREPLRIILRSRVHGLEAHVGGVDKAQQVDHELGASHEREDSSQQHCERNEKVRLGVASLRFKALEFFCE